MRLMTAEKLIEVLSKTGCRIFVLDNEVSLQGGGIHNKPNSHPLWKLLLLHYSVLCKHFGVPE